MIYATCDRRRRTGPGARGRLHRPSSELRLLPGSIIEGPVLCSLRAQPQCCSPHSTKCHHVPRSIKATEWRVPIMPCHDPDLDRMMHKVTDSPAYRELSKITAAIMTGPRSRLPRPCGVPHDEISSKPQLQEGRICPTMPILTMLIMLIMAVCPSRSFQLYRAQMLNYPSSRPFCCCLGERSNLFSGLGSMTGSWQPDH